MFDHNTVDNDGSATIFLYGGFSRAAHDYHLKPTSSSKRSGTDGTDLGIDFVTLEAAMNPPAPIPPIR